MKLPLREQPKTKYRVINGHPAACRKCRYVMDPDFRLVPGEMVGDKVCGRPEHYEVICCRESPPQVFGWSRVEIEPFCGRFAEAEGEVEASGMPCAESQPTPKPPTELPTAKPSSAEPRKREQREQRMPIPTFGPPLPDVAAAVATAMKSVDLGTVSLSLRPGQPE